MGYLVFLPVGVVRKMLPVLGRCEPRHVGPSPGAGTHRPAGRLQPVKRKGPPCGYGQAAGGAGSARNHPYQHRLGTVHEGRHLHLHLQERVTYVYPLGNALGFAVGIGHFHVDLVGVSGLQRGGQG